ncbi:MAG: hypothetical protein ACOY33_06265 [Pseudomonadota bacterium]
MPLPSPGRPARRTLRLTTALLLLLSAVGAVAGDVDDYQGSWIHKALTLQRNLDHFAPLSQATFLATHNSYNSAVWSNATRYIDPNQSRSVYDQLRMDVRGLEYDVHTYFSMQGWPWEWKNRLLLCHGQDNHTGCSSYDRTFRDGMQDVANWLRANPGQVVILYLEDHIDGGWYNTAVSEIQATVGSYVYRPRSGGCEGIPMNISKADVIAAGKQLILMTDGCSNGFNSWVYGGVGDSLSGYPTGSVENLGGYPNCESGRFSRAFHDTHIVRYYEDRTNLSAAFGDPGEPITPSVMPSLLACGVNLIGLDKLTPWDGRLEAAVWSWNGNEPNDWGGAEDCAEHYANGRYNDNNCGAVRQFACKKPGTHEWYVTGRSGAWNTGSQACTAETGGVYRFSVPTTPYDNRKLMEAKAYLGIGTVWLNYTDSGAEGVWVVGNPF